MFNGVAKERLVARVERVGDWADSPLWWRLWDQIRLSHFKLLSEDLLYIYGLMKRVKIVDSTSQLAILAAVYKVPDSLHSKTVRSLGRSRKRYSTYQVARVVRIAKPRP